MTRRIVAHTTGYADKDGEQLVRRGDSFTVIDEPVDFITSLLLARIEREGKKGDALLVDFGEAYMVMTEKPNAEGRSVTDLFVVEEL